MSMNYSSTTEYPEMSDFEKVLFLEAYNRQLKLALSEKTNKLHDFNERFNDMKAVLKKKFPGWSRLVTYKEELKVSRRQAKRAKLLQERAEVNVMGLQIDIAMLKSENKKMKLMVETPTN